MRLNLRIDQQLLWRRCIVLLVQVWIIAGAGGFFAERVYRAGGAGVAGCRCRCAWSLAQVWKKGRDLRRKTVSHALRWCRSSVTNHTCATGKRDLRHAEWLSNETPRSIIAWGCHRPQSPFQGQNRAFPPLECAWTMEGKKGRVLPLD